eukprot:Rhum_TRINITY_DN9093_c0_g1::Rhum_TRINITY_DN9093_c0_g1_i1::g.31456::m.31456/K15277/SLC35B3, PAPST2; solute carrier family 35 (adenosine 3'-phospho 5'-phosphosulfate transporter), member B3
MAASLNGRRPKVAAAAAATTTTTTITAAAAATAGVPPADAQVHRRERSTAPAPAAAAAAVTSPAHSPEAEDAAKTPSSAAKAAAAAAAAPAAAPRRGGIFVLLVAALFLFPCLEAVFKEEIFYLDGFTHVEGLTVLQSGLVAVAAVFDVLWTREAGSGCGLWGGRRSGTPLWVYVVLGTLTALTQDLTHRGILHLDYATHIAMKSSKLLWVMAGRVLFLRQKQRPSAAEWVGSIVIVVGLVVMTADEASPEVVGAAAAGAAVERSRRMGLVCITLSLLCDAAILIVEEGIVFGRHRAPTQEVILYVQVLAVVPSLLLLVGNGGMPEFVSFAAASPRFLLLSTGCGVCGYVGTKSVLSLVESFGGTVAALVTSLRKVVTIVLSFIFFPKVLTFQYATGAALILFGANASSLKRKDDRL